MIIFRNIIVLTLILAYNAACGQVDTTLQKLIDNKLIEKKDSKEFLNLLRFYSNTKASYLFGLYQIELKKVTGEPYHALTILNFEDYKPTETKQKYINIELSAYLTKIKNCGLITDKGFREFQGKINNNNYVHILQLLPEITNQSVYTEYMNPSKLRFFADKLKSKEIVTSKYEMLLFDIEHGKIENPIAFLNYCNKAVIVIEDDYPEKPEQYLEEIYRKTASILPELAFTEFTFQTILDRSISDNDSKFYDIVVSLQSNGRKYKQKIHYQLYNQSKNQYYSNKIDQEKYYKIFNKILTDLQSPYRLHVVKVLQNNVVDWKSFGVIALTEEQGEFLHNDTESYLSHSYESFKNKLTSDKVEQAIEAYKKIGLLSHLTTKQIETAEEKVAEQENNYLNDVLMCFPDVIYFFDTELENLQDPYAELIKEYSKISHNDFNATDISDDFNIDKNKKAILKFKIGDKYYVKTFKINNDWIDTTFFEFINHIVTENKLKRQFYRLDTGGQDASIIYLTKEQYEYLRANKFLVFIDEFSDH